MFTRHTQLMAYSDGTSGCEPNICTHDLSGFPRGLTTEKYSDPIVSACVRGVFMCARVCGAALLLFCKLVSTPTHTPNHQRAKWNNGAGEVTGLAGVSLLCASLSLSHSLCLI